MSIRLRIEFLQLSRFNNRFDSGGYGRHKRVYYLLILRERHTNDAHSPSVIHFRYNFMNT